MQRVDPAEAIVTHDSGSPRDQIMPFYQAGGPRTYLGWGKSHGLGTGLGLSIGAKLAAPDKFVVNYMGDAAFGMTGLDVETAVRCKIPILTIVLNNSSMAIETRHLPLSHAKYRTRDIGGDYADMATAMGAWAERVDEPDDVGPALERARRARKTVGRRCWSSSRARKLPFRIRTRSAKRPVVEAIPAAPRCRGTSETGLAGQGLNVDDEQRLLVAGVLRQHFSARSEDRGLAGHAMRPFGTLVERGTGVLGIQVQREHPQPFSQVLGPALERIPLVESQDFVP